MIDIATAELKNDMILAADVMNRGKVLLPKDTKLDDAAIKKLNRFNIMCVTVMEDVDYAVTHREKMQYDKNFKAFKAAYSLGLEKYKQLFKKFIVSGTPVQEEDLMKIYTSIVITIPSTDLLLDYIYNMEPNKDEMTYTHSLNSALLAGLFATWISLPKEDKKTLIVAGFYYDIGKLKLPYEVLWKPGKLTDDEYNLIKTHPLIGYALVHYLPLPKEIKETILMHHERYDGSGYPSHYKGDKISLFARYYSIIDTYIAMASPRTYRNAFTPLSIVGNFEKNISQYDKTILIPLIKRIADAQVGMKILLSDKSIWEVLVVNPNCYSRPILKNDKGETLDLNDYPELEITDYV